MASRRVQIVRLVDASEADAIIKEAGDKTRITNLERWFDKTPPAKSLFWDVMERGYRDGGIPFARVFKSFMLRFPDAPSVDAQSAKRLVDAKFSNG